MSDNDDYAQGWRADVGDRLVGTVEGLSSHDAGYGRYAILTIRCAEGSTEAGEPIEVGELRALHGTGKVLETELLERQPGVGDELDLTYVGRKGERQYRAYKFGADKPFDWGELGAAPKKQPTLAGDPTITPGPTEPETDEHDGDEAIPF